MTYHILYINLHFCGFYFHTNCIYFLFTSVYFVFPTKEVAVSTCYYWLLLFLSRWINKNESLFRMDCDTLGEMNGCGIPGGNPALFRQRKSTNPTSRDLLGSEIDR